MEPTLTFDINFVETKKSKELRILTQFGIQKCTSITWFETPDKITSNLIKITTDLKSTEVALNKLPAKASYLNLSNTRRINAIEVVDKFTVDQDITFSKPQ
jgi:hypothetical protein